MRLITINLISIQPVNSKIKAEKEFPEFKLSGEIVLWCRQRKPEQPEQLTARYDRSTGYVSCIWISNRF